MQCPRCKHNLKGNTETCLYCGTYLENTPPRARQPKTARQKEAVLTAKIREMIAAGELPVAVGKYFDTGIAADGQQMASPQSIPSGNNSPGGQESEPAAVALERVVSVLAQTRAACDSGRIDHRAYRQLAVSTLKEYVQTLAADARISFVFNEIKTSELGPYLDEEILKELRALVLTSLSEPALK